MTSDIVRELLSYAIPASVSQALGLAQSTINLVFIGRLDDPLLLAAVGVGSMLLNMISIGPYLGINSGLDTLVSQAYGAGNKTLCGVYL